MDSEHKFETIDTANGTRKSGRKSFVCVCVVWHESLGTDRHNTVNGMSWIQSSATDETSWPAQMTN